MSYGLKYNTSTVDLGGGLKVCKFCGNSLTHYEDRMGFDYREDGDHYNSCDCDGAVAEQEKIKDQRGLDYEIKKIETEHNATLAETISVKQKYLDAKYKNRLSPTFDADKLKYEIELNDLKSKYNQGDHKLINDVFDTK